MVAAFCPFGLGDVWRFAMGSAFGCVKEAWAFVGGHLLHTWSGKCAVIPAGQHQLGAADCGKCRGFGGDRLLPVWSGKCAVVRGDSIRPPMVWGASYYGRKRELLGGCVLSIWCADSWWPNRVALLA